MRYSKDLLLQFKEDEFESLVSYSREVSYKLEKIPGYGIESLEGLVETFTLQVMNQRDGIISDFLDLVYNNPVLKGVKYSNDDTLVDNYIYEALSLKNIVDSHDTYKYHHINEVLLFPSRVVLGTLMNLNLISKSTLKDTSSLHGILLDLSRIRNTILAKLSFLTAYYESMNDELSTLANYDYYDNMNVGRVTAILSNLAGIMYALYSTLSSVYTQKYNELVYDIFGRNRKNYPCIIHDLIFKFKERYGGLMAVNFPLATNTSYEIVAQDEHNLIALPNGNDLDYTIELGNINEKVIISSNDVVFVYQANEMGVQIEDSLLSLLSLDTGKDMYKELIEQSILEYSKALDLSITSSSTLTMNSIICLDLKNYTSDLELLYENSKDTELKENGLAYKSITIVTPIKKNMISLDNFNDALLTITYASLLPTNNPE